MSKLIIGSPDTGGSNPDYAESTPQQYINPDEFKKSFEQTQNQLEKPSLPSIFKGGKMAEVCEKEFAPLVPLFDEFIFDGELSVLFADTNIGKSILSVQIAEEMTNQHNRRLSDKLAAERNKILQDPVNRKVLYFDFELSDRQFKHRYTNKQTGKTFLPHENILRLTIDRDNWSVTDEPVKTLTDGFEQMVKQHDPQCIIIDNLTYLQSDGGLTGREAGGIMNHLKKLQQSSKKGLTVIVVAHTPKRDNSKPLTFNDLAGSKYFSNFADSIFCIGKSYQEENLCYIKQVKVRADEMLYHDDSVVLCNRIKSDDGYLHFDFFGYGQESNHLWRPSKEQDKAQRDNDIIDMINEGQKTHEEIGELFGITKQAISKIKYANADKIKPELMKVSTRLTVG